MDSSGLSVVINGQAREFAGLQTGDNLVRLVAELGMKADRVAVELNGEIAPRSTWEERLVRAGDRLEIVHFVGGGVR